MTRVWFRVRSIAASLRQTPAALLYFLPLAVCGLLLSHHAAHPELHAAMTWKAVIVTVYWVVIATWLSFGPLTRWSWFDAGRFMLQWLASGLLGLILWAIFKPAPHLTAGHGIVWVSISLSIAWNNFACDWPACARLFGLVEVARESEEYQSYVVAGDGKTIAVPARHLRNLRACAFCGQGVRPHKWTRDPKKYFAMVAEELKHYTDQKKKIAAGAVYVSLGLLLFGLLWVIGKLRGKASALQPVIK